MKLSRKALEKAAKETPIEHILGRQVSGALTPKQRKFAHEVAKGATKADAYRASYDVTSQRTLNVEPYMLSRDPRIAREIDAYALAIEAEKHRTPAALRSLVIQGLVQVALSEDTKDSVRVQALKTLGTVTEEEKAETLRKIDDGTWAYFVARVEARKEEITLGTAYLGGCCYDSVSQFVEYSDYYGDMVEEAVEEARTVIAKLTA